MHKEHFCTTETPQKITEISRKITENHGKSRKITENHGKSRKIMEGFFQANHGNSRIPAMVRMGLPTHDGISFLSL